MYNSPIEIIEGQIRMEVEDNILRAVLKHDIHVDKFELLRALQYDRGQYEKGYQDASAFLHENNPYWERVCAIADRQREKGISTYGQGIEKNPADIIKRIDHLQEELVDALMYCEWIKDVTDNNVGGKWIPVTERLPGFDTERVLVVTQGELILGYPKMDTDRYRNGRWVRYGSNVTHWMPLPEAPKEGIDGI